MEKDDMDQYVEDLTEEDKNRMKFNLKNPPKTHVTEIICDCGCDYMIPLMKMQYVNTFAGNKLQVTFPTRQTGGESAIVKCPACDALWIIDNTGKMTKKDG